MEGEAVAEPSRYPPAVVIPRNALVLLIGASASGKSSWTGRWFLPTQIVSSDRCRALVSDDEANQRVNTQAFAVFYEIISRRLELGCLTVADSTALTTYPRERLRSLASHFGAPAVAVVICTPLEALLRNNQSRRRRVPEEVLARHDAQLRELVFGGVLEREGYHAVHYLRFPHLPRPRFTAPMLAASEAAE
jgi:predicted kinase